MVTAASDKNHGVKIAATRYTWGGDASLYQDLVTMRELVRAQPENIELRKAAISAIVIGATDSALAVTTPPRMSMTCANSWTTTL